MVSGFADNDAGGITTYSVVGAQFGYALLWIVLASMLALFVTQEAGARLGLATGRGLLDLIRESFGIRWAALAIVTMLIANLGTTISEFAGIGAALSLFGVPVPVSDAVAVVVVGALLARSGFLRIQYVFLAIGAGVSVAYAVSAILAHPDWAKSAKNLIVPHGHLTSAYLLAVVGTVGTTITPWGQAFIQSYCADKRLGPEHLRTSRFDVGLGAFLTNTIAAFIVIAAAATLWAHGHTSIPDAAAAAKALGPLAGHSAETVFALGLARRGVPRARGRAADERVRDDGGARPGARARLPPPPGTGVLRPARVLPRRRGPVRADSGPAADPRDVPRPGRQRPPAPVILVFVMLLSRRTACSAT